jgi:hypothetical protein
MQNSRYAAIDLVSLHGRRARQVVADHILEAVRNHDMVAAKQWNAVGRAVDERLDKAERRRLQLNDNECAMENPGSRGPSGSA